MMYAHCLFVFVLLVDYVTALSPTFLPCQLQKPPGVSPLLGCPEGTIFVSQTDKEAHFMHVQDAILSLYVHPTAMGFSASCPTDP